MRSVLVICLIVSGVGLAQESSDVALTNGVQIRISAQSSTGDIARLKSDLQPASGNSFYRIYRDENGLAVFAYELKVERTSDGTQFRVTALPAEAEFAARFPNADGGKPTPTLSEVHQSPLLDPGLSFSIAIPTDPGLQLNLNDVVQVQINERGVSPDSGAKSIAEIRFVALRVRVDGNLVAGGGAGAIVAGRYAMFYIPGSGGFFFSTQPVERRPFVQVGVVDRSKLTFTLENHVYDCESENPILLKSDRGQIWVYHDPNYKPDGNWTKSDTSDGSRDEFYAAASDSLNWWLP